MDVRMIEARDVLTKDYVTLGVGDTLAKFIGTLYGSRQEFGIVLDKRKYVGVVDGTSVVRSKLAPNRAKIGSFIRKPPVATPDLSVPELAELLYHSHPVVLPVMQRDKLLGVVRASDLIALIPSISELKQLKVFSVMTSDLVMVSLHERLGTALNLMREKHIDRLPVLDEGGKFVGIVSYVDILKKYLVWPAKRMGGHLPHGTVVPKSFVGDKLFVLDTPIINETNVAPIIARPDEPVGVVVDRMVRNNLKSMMIVGKDDVPVGIITTRDLLRLFFKFKKPELWNVHFAGVDELKPGYAGAVKELVFERYEKIKRAFAHDIMELVFHIKRYDEKQMGAHPNEIGETRYHIDLRLTTTMGVFAARETHWDLMTAVAWIMDKLEREVARRKSKLMDVSRGRITGRAGGRRTRFRRQQIEEALKRTV